MDNTEIRSALTARNALQERLKHNRTNTELQEQYRRERNRVKSLIHNAERDYYRREFKNCKGNVSATWRLIKNIVPSIKVINNSSEYDNALEKAEEFNELFVNVGKRTYERKQSQLSYVNSTQEAQRYNEVHEHLFWPEPVDMNTVILTIKHLKHTNSVGSDGISLQHLRDSLPVIVHYLTTIINTSIVTGNFPSAWKHATVTPFFKSGDSHNVNNYRPIYHCCQFSQKF